MRIIYQGTDITDSVRVRACIARDASSGRCDSLEILLEDAATWTAWGPQEGDAIEVTEGGYSTGAQYLSAVAPEDGRYRLLAASLPPRARARGWQSFENTTLAGVMRACAAQCGMGWALYGLDGALEVPWLLRRDEGCAALLERLLRLEGGVLKCAGGRLCGIGIEWAQARAPAQAIALAADQPGAAYRRSAGRRLASLRVATPWADAAAMDSAAAGGEARTIAHAPARSAAQAGRWARGLLLAANRRAEELVLDSEFNAGWTALARVDVLGATDAAGDWIIDDVTHNLVNGTSQARLLRCVTTVR